MVYRGIITVDRTFKAFAHLACANRAILERAKKKEPGYYWDVMASLVFSAFTFEASLNHIGPKAISYWKELERLPMTNKLSILLEHLKLSPDFGKRPYQSLRQLYGLRNALAHGRDQELSFGPEERVIDDATFKAFDFVRSKPEELCTIEYAEAAYADMETIVVGLFEAAGLGDYRFEAFDTASYSISFISEIEKKG